MLRLSIFSVGWDRYLKMTNLKSCSINWRQPEKWRQPQNVDDFKLNDDYTNEDNL